VGFSRCDPPCQKDTFRDRFYAILKFVPGNYLLTRGRYLLNPKNLESFVQKSQKLSEPIRASSRGTQETEPTTGPNDQRRWARSNLELLQLQTGSGSSKLKEEEFANPDLEDTLFSSFEEGIPT